MAHGLRLTLPRRWQLDDYTIDKIGHITIFVITFTLGWALMIWGWGGWVGGLMGWIPALVLASLVAPIWRMAIAGGALLALLLMLMRIL